MHIAFAAGTGVLVYLDLVTLLLKIVTGNYKGNSMDFINIRKFKLIFYASFGSPEDSVGLELLELFQQFCVKKELDVFELRLRFSKNEQSTEYAKDRKHVSVGTRWDAEFIDKELLPLKDSIKRIWVCGPPKMNQDIDEALRHNGHNYGITMNDVEVM